MKWQDDHDESTGHELPHSLTALVETFGVDCTYAPDVVDAVLSFCQTRHGTRLVSSDYLTFLLARSAYVAQGACLSTDMLDGIELPLTQHQHMHLRALMNADDPPALYEACRRGLLGAVTTSLAGSGVALQLNMDCIKALPHDDISLIWQPVLRKISGWISHWRHGNSSIRLIMIKGTNAWAFTERNKRRQLLVSLIRQIETTKSWAPADIVWLK